MLTRVPPAPRRASTESASLERIVPEARTATPARLCAPGTRTAGLAAIAYNFARMGSAAPTWAGILAANPVAGEPNAHGRLAAAHRNGGRLERSCQQSAPAERRDGGRPAPAG